MAFTWECEAVTGADAAALAAAVKARLNIIAPLGTTGNDPNVIGLEVTFMTETDAFITYQKNTTS